MARSACHWFTQYGTGVAYVTMLVSLLLLSLFAGFLLLGRTILTETTLGRSPLAGGAWFLLAIVYAAGALRIAQWQLPIEQLVSADRRSAVEERLHTVGRITLATTLVSVSALFLLGISWLGGLFEQLLAAGPGLDAAFDALATTPVLGPIAGVGTIALLASVVAFLLRMATRRLEGTTLRVAAAAASGVCLSVLPIVSIPINPVGTAQILAALLVVPVGLIAVAGIGLLAVRIDLVPDRSGAPAVAAAGLVFAAVGFGRQSAIVGWESSVIVFACVAGAAIVWDLSWFGLGLTAELGHIPDTRRLELFHGVLVVGLGLVTVAVLTGLDLLRTSAFGGGGNTVALFLAGIGVLLLLLPLRG
jgi:hypothetical protein